MTYTLNAALDSATAITIAIAAGNTGPNAANNVTIVLNNLGYINSALAAGVGIGNATLYAAISAGNAFATPGSMLAKDICNVVNNHRDMLLTTGGVPVSGKWFASDQLNRTRYLALAQLGANLPANTNWYAMDGSTVPLTQALVTQILAAAAVQEAAIFDYAMTLCAQVMAAANPNTIAITIGWPAVFVPAP